MSTVLGVAPERQANGTHATGSTASTLPRGNASADAAVQLGVRPRADRSSQRLTAPSCREFTPGESTASPSKHRKLGRALLSVAGVLIGLILAEASARVLSPRWRGSFAFNQIMAKQRDRVDLFQEDEDTGQCLTHGGFVNVYETGFVTIPEIAADARRNGRLVVLNLGDSSTSGWDSRVIAGNAARRARGEPLESPFQRYRTYSDLLAQDSRLYVINAGVPGFSSAQGDRYASRLLRQFRELGIHIDAVTLYFGNNDSVWDGNLQDRYLLPGQWRHIHLLRLFDQASWRQRVVPRVTPIEFGHNLRAIIGTCREEGSHVILLDPLVPRLWPPGLRMQGLEQEVTNFLLEHNGSRISAELAQANSFYLEGLRALDDGDLARARQRLEQASQSDFLVPRIKESYRQVLQQVAKEQHVPLVSVGASIPTDDKQYFCDYCHPIDPANRLIADAILKTLRQWSPPPRST